MRNELHLRVPERSPLDGHRKKPTWLARRCSRVKTRLHRTRHLYALIVGHGATTRERVEVTAAGEDLASARASKRTTRCAVTTVHIIETPNGSAPSVWATQTRRTPDTPIAVASVPPARQRVSRLQCTTPREAPPQRRKSEFWRRGGRAGRPSNSDSLFGVMKPLTSCDRRQPRVRDLTIRVHHPPTPTRGPCVRLSLYLCGVGRATLVPPHSMTRVRFLSIARAAWMPHDWHVPSSGVVRLRPCGRRFCSRARRWAALEIAWRLGCFSRAWAWEWWRCQCR